MRTACLFLVLSTLAALDARAHPYLAAPAVPIGDARSLPWNGETDYGLVADYRLSRLVPDTLAALTATAPPLVRFETLRRAALYLSPRFATPEAAPPVRALLARRLEDRVRREGHTPRLAALSRFDLGCFEALCGMDRTLSSGRDGYALAKRAVADLPEAAAEIEYVLCRVAPPGTVGDEHRAAALRGAAEGTPLAACILGDFDHEFATLADLRASLEAPDQGAAPGFPQFPQPPPVPGADPSHRDSVVLLVPSALSARPAGDALEVGWVAADPQAVRLDLGHRMVVGTHVDAGVWVGDVRVAAHDTDTLLGGEPLGAVGEKGYLRDLRRSRDGAPVVLRAKVQVFETDVPPQHMWSPTGGRYRVLWERTYEVRLP